MDSRNVNRAFSNATSEVRGIIDETLEGITREVVSRAYRASNHLRNASQYVLRGKRNGRKYRVPTTRRRYTASAPGEPPAVRTGAFRLSWGTHVHVEKSGNVFKTVSSIESSLKTPNGMLLGDLLEDGSSGGRLAPRPYKQATRDRAMPNIVELYRRPYV